MDILRIFDRLSRFPGALDALVSGIDIADARWKPEPDKWSILEIVCHLADEEVEDFRQRLRMTLENPAAEWPKIDPPKAAVDRRYNEQDLEASLSRFARERESSLAWLRGLADPDWETSYRHPKIGRIPAGLLLSSWVAHDQLHLRQIARRLYDLSTRDAAPYPNDYAGEW